MGFVVGKIWMQGGNLANANLLKRECGESLRSAIALKAQNEGAPALPCPPPESHPLPHAPGECQAASGPGPTPLLPLPPRSARRRRSAVE